MHAATPRPNARRLIAVTTTLLLAGAAACSAQGNNDPAPTKPSAPAAAPAAEPWREKFTPAQVDEYEKALALFTEYERVSEPIWATGKATPEAIQLLERYTYLDFATEMLRENDELGITLSGEPKVLSSEPSSVDIEAGKVVIRQCIDPSDYRFVFPGATPAPGGNNPEGDPYVREVTLRAVESASAYRVVGVYSQKEPGRVELCGD